MLRGVDVSNWQGEYAWPDNLAFGFVKATEGLTFTDDQFTRNWSQMKAKGLVRGAYHFGHPANSATAEADRFLSVVRGRGLAAGELLALDLEDNDGKSPAAVAAWAKTWCQRVEAKTGIVPVLYTFVSFARGGYCAGLGRYPLWIAAPSYTAGSPPMPLGPWSTWAIHQYADSPVDLNVSKLTVAELRSLGGTTTEEEMPEYVSVGATKARDLPPNTWTTIEFDTEYADSDHNHYDKGGSSVVTGPAKYSLNVYVRINGLPVGTEGQIRLTRVATKDGTDRQAGPIQEFAATSGEHYLTYAIPVDSIGEGRKTRVEIIQWGDAKARIVSAQLKALIWS